ncbi:hypothetical protein ACKWTF_002790 [Chironomus riparius]
MGLLCITKLLKFVMLLLTLTLEIESASRWYTGENKPYDFGYTIEGNQHRRESKDIHGVINGEYGFITADNVYHVTVYATDENGNFKIISMKNIKLYKQSEQPQPPVTSTTPQPFTVKATDPPTMEPSKKTIGEACASCKFIPKPETETVKPSVLPDEESSTIPPPFKIVSKEDPSSDGQQQKVVNENIDNSISVDVNKQGGQLENKSQNNNNINNFNVPSKADGRQPSFNEKLNSVELSNNKLQSGQFNQLQGGQQQQQNSNGLLYRFDYATDFNGHKEEGDRSGNKDGEYFSIGRDNVKRVVSYKANEFGYMPYIRQEPLGYQFDERNNQLRRYNFEWFYPHSTLYG